MNLTEIKDNEYKKWQENGNGYDYTIACMKEAARKALKLASERAKIDYSGNHFWVDPDSILDVMEEIE